MGRFTGWFAGAALLASGCAAPGLLPDRWAASSVTTQALMQAQQHYLYPQRLNEEVMIGALDALEKRFDSVRFEPEEGEELGILTVGAASARVPLAKELDPEDFQRVLGQALAFTEENLGDELDAGEDQSLELTALSGALAALDRYSTIYSGRRTEDFQIRFSGKLHGIGARIGRRDGELVAVRVFADSPAERGGLKDGDEILAIDGNPTRPLTLEDAVGQIRGKTGTHVHLSILREEEGELELDITRGEVRIPSVDAKLLEEGIGYARIESVSRTTASEFREKVLALGQLSTGLVLDLRGNTGGSMKAASDLADFFLERGVIVSVVDRDGRAVERAGTMAKPDVLLGSHVVILVDPATASAAEILSGAMAPLARVTVIGQTTFGKGLIQRVMPLPQQTLLKLTVAEYLLSGDREIHEKGIEPDITLFPVSTEHLGRLAKLPDGALPYLRRRGEDDSFPVDFATELLRETQDQSLRDSRAQTVARARERSDTEIRAELESYEIPWGTSLDGEFDENLIITAQSAPLRAGQESSVRVEVRNPNAFAIPNAWVTLMGPAPYLRNRMAPLGTIPAAGSAQATISVTSDEGLSVNELPASLVVASGRRSLQSEKVALAIEQQQPVVAIGIERTAEDQVQVTLRNIGCCDTGKIRVVVPGAVRSFEQLLPGTEEVAELLVTGKAENVRVVLNGAGVQRLIEIPIPEESAVVEVVPPVILLARDSWLGRPRIEIEARSSPKDALQEGWIAFDSQKEAYVAWNGSETGRLRTEIEPDPEKEEHNLTTKIETVSGVSVMDSRTFALD